MVAGIHAGIKFQFLTTSKIDFLLSKNVWQYDSGNNENKSHLAADAQVQ
jgi:hypothetical protein